MYDLHTPAFALRRARWLLPVVLASLALLPPARAQQPPDKQLTPVKSLATDTERKLITESKFGSEIMKNLTQLCDEIGPRLTGTPALKKANEWAAARMKAYGLTNVHLEAWEMPEGWKRGHARARLIEPNNGQQLALASYGWTHGTNGQIKGDVVAMTATKLEDLDAYKGKLKGAIVLQGPPATLVALADADKSAFGPPPGVKKGAKQPNYEELFAFRKALREFLVKEGAAAIFQDAGKHFNLLATTGGWGKWAGTDRPSATNKVPMLFVAHDHYAMLYRLAARPAPARTRVELDVANEFIPGPIAAYNTVGEIRGTEKPDEFVVIGAHLDSWDLGQGALDNGTGSTVVLEAARLLVKSGAAPKRTIRFILFTGEEQGLHGSKAYCDRHKDEMAKTSACIVHDTGTGKVTGLGWLGRPDLKELLDKELAVLHELGVKDIVGRGYGGSDHASFSQAGVPGCAVNQEAAGYRFAHHSQADTLGLAREDDLIQGAQVMAVAALRLANMDQLLPRDKK
jgi:hypothetical protein